MTEARREARALERRESELIWAIGKVASSEIKYIQLRLLRAKEQKYRRYNHRLRGQSLSEEMNEWI